MAKQLRAEEKLQDARLEDLPASGHVLISAIAVTETSARPIACWEDGVPQPLEVLRMVERERGLRQHGRMSATLHALTDAVEDAEVVIVFKSDNVLPIDLAKYENSGIDPTQAIELERTRIRAHLSRLRAPLTRFLEDAGATGIEPLANAPAIRARLTSTLLRSLALNTRPDVVILDTPIPELPRHSYAGHGALGELSVSGPNCVYTPCGGFGLGVAIWESAYGDGAVPGILSVANQRFFLHDQIAMKAGRSCSGTAACSSTNINNLSPCVQGVCRDEHASLVAASIGLTGGYVQQSFNFPKAGAYYVRYKFANDAGLAGLDWAATQNVLYVNRSQGVGTISPTSSTAIVLDWYARIQLMTISVAAGNSGDVPNGDYADCGSYNTLCVGAAEYRTWNVRTGDDLMPAWSSWRNKPGFGAEWPHVVGPGGETLTLPDICQSTDSMRRNSCTLSLNNSVLNRGTSFAAPAILGASLITHEYFGYFSNFAYPAMRKIALMTSATDVAQDGPVPVIGVDGHDGAGMPDLSRLYWINYYSWYATKFATPADFSNDAMLWVKDMYFAGRADGGREALRIGMAWNSCSSSTSATNILADFDLYIQRPAACGGGFISSTRVNSEFEMLYDRCLPPYTSGTYRIYIKKKSGTSFSLCGGESSEPIHVAWDAVWE